jgi:pilus assembly protein CpaD
METTMQSICTMSGESRCHRGPAVRAAVFAAGVALLLCGCNTDQQIAGVPEVPPDYRMRHPITLSEADRTLEVFIGSNRGALNPTQRAELLAFAQNWRHEATGGVVVDLPAGTSNERSAAEAMHEIRSILNASGVPADGVVVRGYHPPAGKLATIRVTYPRIAAQAGPCGLWPEDIGPSFNRDYFENQQYWNLGCSSQRNLAAMVEDPADLVQPRGETPAYTMRRTTVVEKYRTGNSPATIYPNNNAAKISDFATQ